MKGAAVQPVPRTAWSSQRSFQGIVGVVWLLVLGAVNEPIVQWSAQAVLTLLLVLVVGLALYIGPGLAVLRLLWQDASLTRTERVALAAGFGVALPPLLLQTAHLLGLRWGPVGVYTYILVSAAIALLPRRGRHWQLPRLTRPRIDSHTLLLAAVVGTGLVVRLFLIRDLPVGMWGDSYHHTMIAELLVRNGGLFSSWQPYAPLSTFTYHYGFHANVAFFHWLTGQPVTTSLLLVGQLLNTLALPLAYVLTSRLSGSRTAGLWAAVLVGFVNSLPTLYVNWGRYTQLTGQLLVPVVLVCVGAALEAPGLHWRPILLAGLATGCLMLTHYIVTIFTALFVLAYLVFLVVRSRQPHVWRRVALGALAIGSVGIVLAAPWLANTLSGYLGRNVASFVQHDGVSQTRIVETATFQPLVPTYINPFVLWLAYAGTLLAVVRRRWHMALVAVWTGLLLLTVIPDRVGLPGAGVIGFFTAAIALYLTVVPLAAYALSTIQRLLTKWQPRWGRVVGTAALLGTTVWGVHWQQHALNPFFELFTPADARAMDWIKANTPSDALFLVNMFPAYGGTLEAGDDGGWWLPLLTGRRSTLPPITYGSERADSPDYGSRINAFATALQRSPLPSARALQLLRGAGVRYIYSGPHREHLQERVDVVALRQHPAFRTVYDREGVVIFEVLPTP